MDNSITYNDIAKIYDSMEKQCTDSLVSFDIDSLSIESLRHKYRSLLIQQKEVELAYLKDQAAFAITLLEAKTKCNELESQLRSTTHSYHELEKERDKLWKYAAEINITESERGYWAWQEADNDLETLTCPVLIPAATLRSLFTKINELQVLNEWQPIASAPKDGTEIILKVKSRAGIPKKFLIGHWASGCNDYQAIKGGWYFWNGCLFDDAAEPLEWLPLPEDSQA